MMVGRPRCRPWSSCSPSAACRFEWARALENCCCATMLSCVGVLHAAWFPNCGFSSCVVEAAVATPFLPSRARSRKTLYYRSWRHTGRGSIPDPSTPRAELPTPMFSLLQDSATFLILLCRVAITAAEALSLCLSEILKILFWLGFCLCLMQQKAWELVNSQQNFAWWERGRSWSVPNVEYSSRPCDS
jgi:hypothetical protein